MSRRTEPPFRPPTDEVGGLRGILLFIGFLLMELAVAAVVCVIAYRCGSGEMVDMIDALGIGGALAIGCVAIWGLDSLCSRRTGYSPFMLVGGIAEWM